jgi:hypothetical protein
MGADGKELHGPLIPVFICVHLRHLRLGHLRFIFFPSPAPLFHNFLPQMTQMSADGKELMAR